MQSLCNHVILIGFKHVGKSVIGEQLAKKLHVSFVDLDKNIELLYEKKFNKKNTYRQILQTQGEVLFRQLEMQALSDVMSLGPCILSLGGGTPLCTENQRIIQSCKTSVLIHVTAPRGVVFERILMSGRPAFFNSDEDLLAGFNRLWDEREKIYEKLRKFSVENDGSVDDCVKKIATKLGLDV